MRRNSPRLEKYKRSSPFGYHHEKIALVKLAQHLSRNGWHEVLLSVRPDSLAGELEGLDPATLHGVNLASDELFGPEFRELFDNDLKHRYEFYGDKPGGIDLVARRYDELLLVESKGESKRDRKGAVYELIGRQVAARLDDDPRSFGILIPDTWRVVLPTRSKLLEWLKIYLIERETGRITEAQLPEPPASSQTA